MLSYNEEEIRKVQLSSFLRRENVTREMQKGVAFRRKFRGDANAHLFFFRKHVQQDAYFIPSRMKVKDTGYKSSKRMLHNKR